MSYVYAIYANPNCFGMFGWFRYHIVTGSGLFWLVSVVYIARYQHRNRREMLGELNGRGPIISSKCKRPFIICLGEHFNIQK